jgi:hypothetical protein
MLPAKVNGDETIVNGWKGSRVIDAVMRKNFLISDSVYEYVDVKCSNNEESK